jgi:hypothetical protein
MTEPLLKIVFSLKHRGFDNNSMNKTGEKTKLFMTYANVISCGSRCLAPSQHLLMPPFLGKKTFVATDTRDQPCVGDTLTLSLISYP